MKTQDYTIEYLKALYPDLEYVDNILYLGEEVIQEDADLLIEEYYDGWEVTKAHSSGNPELETFEEVDGEDYINIMFDGNYEMAYNEI